MALRTRDQGPYNTGSLQYRGPVLQVPVLQDPVLPEYRDPVFFIFYLILILLRLFQQLNYRNSISLTGTEGSVKPVMVEEVYSKHNNVRVGYEPELSIVLFFVVHYELNGILFWAAQV